MGVAPCSDAPESPRLGRIFRRCRFSVYSGQLDAMPALASWLSSFLEQVKLCHALGSDHSCRCLCLRTIACGRLSPGSDLSTHETYISPLILTATKDSIREATRPWQ